MTQSLGSAGGRDRRHKRYAVCPNAGCTRAQAVTFLWRAAGSPEPKTLSSFADVPADAYYAKAPRGRSKTASRRA